MSEPRQRTGGRLPLDEVLGHPGRDHIVEPGRHAGTQLRRPRGEVFMCAYIAVDALDTSNAARPVSASHSTAASEYASARRSLAAVPKRSVAM
jgi:hypothetical protein